MYWTLELASKLEDAPWPATKDELIDYAIRTGAPLEVVENLQEIEDDDENFETILLSTDAEEESREWYRIEGTGEFFVGDLVTLVDGLLFKIRLESLHRQSMEASEQAARFEKEGNEKYLQETEKSGRILQEIQLLKKNRPEGL